MAVFPTGSSATVTQSPTITLSANADQVNYPLPIHIIRWHLSTAITSTWALHMTQSSACAASTVGWPLIGSTGPVFIGGTTSTAAFTAPTGNAIIDFPIDNWCWGAVLSTITGGYVEIIKAPPGLDWVIKRPYMATTVSLG